MRLQNGEALLRWPLARHIITQGWRTNGGGAHGAIDLRTAWDGGTRQPVYAAEDGAVDWVQAWDGRTRTGLQSYGNAVRLLHAPWNGRTLQTRYAHLDTVLVAPGQQVKEGDLLGISGESGNCYGAHLHFEVIWGGARTNPLVWLDGDFTTAGAAVYTYGPGEHAVESAAPPAPVLTTLCIGPASPGDAARLRALAEELALPCQEQ